MWNSIKAAVGAGTSEPDFMKGLEVKEPLPFPGFYETAMRPANRVLWPQTYGRSAKVVVGNPINDAFGTQFELKLDGSGVHPQQAMQQGLPQKRTRHFRAGAYYRSTAGADAPAGASTLQTMMDQSGYVHTRAAQKIGKRAQLVFGGCVSRTITPLNRLMGRAAYRGDTWSATVRAQTITKSAKGAAGAAPSMETFPFAGLSVMKALTHRLSVGGEAYVNGSFYNQKRKSRVPWYVYSGTALWRQNDWLAAIQHSSKPAGPYTFITFARTVGPNVSLATQLLVAHQSWLSRVKIGTSIAMPRTQSKIQFSYDTQGTMQTVWERRLLSTVRLQVTGELALWNFQKQGQNNNRFGICLQIGSVPQPTKAETPVLQIMGYQYDVRPQM